MVEDSVTDGRRVAQLLASEVTGRAGDLADLVVDDADRDADPTEDGAHAYDVRQTGAGGTDGRRVASVHLQPDRVRLDVRAAPVVALETAADLDLRARPRATTPPSTVVFVERGAETKRAADLLGVVARADD